MDESGEIDQEEFEALIRSIMGFVDIEMAD